MQPQKSIHAFGMLVDCKSVDKGEWLNASEEQFPTALMVYIIQRNGETFL